MTATTTPAPSTNGASSRSGAITIRRLERVAYEVQIEGVTPLIVNRWSEKARQMMLDKQQNAARAKKDPKDPVALFESSKYRLPDGRDAFPATGFKAAVVHAARLFDGITQVSMKQTILVKGDGTDARGDELVALDYGEVLMREDTPRNASGVADLRYRAQYNDWSAKLRIHTVEGQIDIESLMALVDAAGVGGVGEWRPTAPKSATGTYGTFRVVDEGSVEVSIDG